MLLCAIPGGVSAAASNQLAGHPSPYLALHAGDPVDWQDWKPDIFTEARAKNRLVLVSIGYFSCHWCHVMQRQSYQHRQTAEFLNRHFIAVKVDRELEPDLDGRMIDFVKALRGAAGWPLHVFITPEGYPLTGFTYLPREDFQQLLQRLDEEWQQNHVALSSSAREFFESRMQLQEQQARDLPRPADEMLQAFVEHALQSADELLGGFGNTSKFPNVPQTQALLASLALSPQRTEEVTEFVSLTLQSMAAGNLQDHVNGGFFRYTTDPDWHTPHFEKMLYDNALLASLYLQADRLWPARGHDRIALRTLDFIEARLRHPEGGYFSSLSAVDRDNREGGAYLWSMQRLGALLDTAELRHLQRRWHLNPLADAFLLRPPDDLGSTGPEPLDQSILQKLRRQAALQMPADDKRLASWNAMMLMALNRAADHDARFGIRAMHLFTRMRELFFADGSLLRLAANTDTAAATFEDYANCAVAFLDYGRRFDDDDAIRLARSLTEQAHRLFYRDGRWHTSIASPLPITRGKRVIEDLVLTSPMTLWLQAALGLPEIDSKLRASAADQLNRVTRDMADKPYYYGSLILLRAGYGD